MARILIAEDEESVRQVLVRGLIHHGHEVVAVGDGGAALDALAAGTFDLLLSDIVMPQMDGISLALKVAKDYPDLRVLLMTGYAAERQRAHNLDDLVSDVMEKPFAIDELISTIDSALAKPH